ncbi:DUF5994 family protein [Catellatospora sp. NPDC049609]|uniref:DUF5994 family protein n=1 Tax=Catellatospora sp. NPDC049609 TaxID=3155505 RepID=UPI0034172132
MKPHVGAPDLMGLVPGSAQRAQRLRLQHTRGGAGLLDGGWWPYSADPAEELPGLVMAIDEIHGPVVGLSLGDAGWHPQPAELHVGGRRIGIDYHASQPASLLTALCADGQRVDLLVVAPQTSWDLAAKAMLQAAQTGNRVAAPHIMPAVEEAHASPR